ncbi:MAG: M56 family metallopeptidase [Terriglobales bacterium]
MIFTLQPFTQTAIERALNSLPEGLLIALLAGTLLRILPRQNSRTRFAVWFAALLAVAGLPALGGLSRLSTASTWSSHAAAAISLPAHWATFLFVVWALAVAVFAARLIVGVWRLHELRQTCNPVDPADLDLTLRALLAELNSANLFPSRPVTLATSASLRVPAAIGLWKPMIVLPPWALRELAPSDLAIIFRHESAHLRHWDDWTNLIQKIVRALFFFHPAVWWIDNRLSIEREMACDDVVVAQTANPAGYASCLVSLLERSLTERGWTMAQAIVHRARETSMRLTRILDNNRPIATRISKPALGLVGAFALLSFVLLPRTPQIVSFEQVASQPVVSEQRLSQQRTAEQGPASTALPQLSATLRPATLKSSQGSRASFQTSSLPAAVTAVSFRPESKAASAQKNLQPLPSNLAAVSAIASGPRKDCRDSAIAENILIAATPDSVLQASQFQATEQGAESGHSIRPSFTELLLVHETQFVESDSSVVWRVQVWRVMLVNPTWERKANVPVAHST